MRTIRTMKTEEEIQNRADEMSDIIELSKGANTDALKIKEVLDWVLD